MIVQILLSVMVEDGFSSHKIPVAIQCNKKL